MQNVSSNSVVVSIKPKLKSLVTEVLSCYILQNNYHTEAEYFWEVHHQTIKILN
jgi:hypothetical protein